MIIDEYFLPQKIYSLICFQACFSAMQYLTRKLNKSVKIINYKKGFTMQFGKVHKRL